MITDIICVFISVLSIALTICIGYLLDLLRLRRLIKEYNKRHPNDLRDFKKSTPWSMNKQFIDWQISNFAKCSNGFSFYENVVAWEVSNEKK